MKKVPHLVQIFIYTILLVCIYNFTTYIYTVYTTNEILAVLSYSFLILSMRQHDIVKLRLFGACAGSCFVVQFALSDLPLVNVIGQGGLVIYGIYQAIQEIKAKKVIDSNS